MRDANEPPEVSNKTVRWTQGTDADDIEREVRVVKPGWRVDFGQTVLSDDPIFDFAAPLVRRSKRRSRTLLRGKGKRIRVPAGTIVRRSDNYEYEKGRDGKWRRLSKYTKMTRGL